jgi:dTDP-4-dehydrorhamnose reductase
MRVLILGGSGMLGHRLWMNLQKVHETWVTVRGDGSCLPKVNEFPKEYIRANVDALIFDEVIRALASIQPDLVINCIGLIKQQGHIAKDPVFSISLNALLPHRISMICRTAGIRMIHISTDCVFSGRKGSYVEEDISDAEDLYGRTKYLGEVAYRPHTITLRTSIIGRELKTHLGLIEWFLSQEGQINGYTKAIYTGFTTDELSNIIVNYVIPNEALTGVYNVSSDPISKFDLLVLAKKMYSKKIEIIPYEDFSCDRSLNSNKFRQETGYEPPSWDEMLFGLAQSSGFYQRLSI